MYASCSLYSVSVEPWRMNLIELVAVDWSSKLMSITSGRYMQLIKYYA